MRILVVGAGALGGYYGGRLIEAGRDVTFLVRPRRAAELKAHGLAIRSPQGDVDLGIPPHIVAAQITEPYDLILFTPKAYDLDGAVAQIAPAVGPRTAILPFQNGMRHVDMLRDAYGPQAVLGGVCLIPATLESPAIVRHLAPVHGLVYGEVDGPALPRTRAIEAAFAGARFDATLSEQVMQEMWEKWVLIAALAGITCLLSGSVGEIARLGGAPLTEALIDECVAIAAEAGRLPRPPALERMRAALLDPAASTTASMLRDLRQGNAVEVEHVLADLLARRAAAPPPVSLLHAAVVRLRIHERQRAG